MPYAGSMLSPLVFSALLFNGRTAIFQWRNFNEYIFITGEALVHPSKWQGPYTVVHAPALTCAQRIKRKYERKSLPVKKNVRIFGVRSMLHLLSTIEFRIPFSVDAIFPRGFIIMWPRTSPVYVWKIVFYLYSTDESSCFE